jgi:F-box protein 11
MPERPEEQIYNNLRTAFTIEELRTLSFLLGVDDESLNQNNRDVLARELVRYMSRIGQIDELVERARRERPHLAWPGATRGAPEPRVLVVDPLHRGDYPTIGQAIAAAQPGHLIKVRPGVYNEEIVIDRPLEIVGDGLREVIVVRSSENVIRMATDNAIVRNLTLRQTGGEWFAVKVSQGHLVLEECDVSSLALACVAIHNGAMATVRRNRIHDGKQGGIYIRDRGEGIIEDNDIVGNTYAGVSIRTGGNPAVRKNRIHDNKQNGIYVWEQGEGIIEENDIIGNTLSGIEIKTGGKPTVRQNRINDNKQSGIHVHNQGEGIIEDNDIIGNTLYGISIKTAGNPSVSRNRIHRNGHQAIWIDEDGAGTFEGNDLRDNAKGAWHIDDSSLPLVWRSGNIE